MRSPRLAILIALLAAPSALAQHLVATVTATSPSVANGGTAGFSATLRNDGTRTFPPVHATLSAAPGRVVAASPGCTLTGTVADCAVDALGPGESRTFTFTGRATNDASEVGKVFRGRITVQTVIPDDQPVFVSAAADVPITLSPNQIDLSVTFDPDPAAPLPLGPTERTITVTNAGPSAATDVTVLVLVSFERVRLLGSSGPWVCSGGDAAGLGTLFTCTASRLAAGESAPLRLRFETIYARSYTLSATVSASDASELPTGNNTARTAEFQAGVASDFTRVLLPLLVSELPGARATWTSQLWAQSYGGGTTMVYCSPDCPPDLNNTTRLYSVDVERLWPRNPGGFPHGAMLYMEKALAPSTSFSSRLFSSRSSAARAVELPVVRESELRTGRVTIPAIILDPSHRFLLRVYDPDAVPNAVVRVRLFTTRTDAVLAERILPLTTNPLTIAPLGLPAAPGYAETADLFAAALPPGAASLQVGVEVVAVTPGLRLWAFVSATENEGEHVTLITPQ